MIVNFYKINVSLRSLYMQCIMYIILIFKLLLLLGVAVVAKEKALLWTDGRYHLQASQQLDSNWTLMKQGVPDVPTLTEWLKKVREREREREREWERKRGRERERAV